MALNDTWCNFLARSSLPFRTLLYAKVDKIAVLQAATMLAHIQWHNAAVGVKLTVSTITYQEFHVHVSLM